MKRDLLLGAVDGKDSVCGLRLGGFIPIQEFRQRVLLQGSLPENSPPSWQKEKLQTDEDYRRNQADAQRRWRESHPDYWRKYRQCHPDYSERNRCLQRERNHIRRRHPIAKMDALAPQTHVTSGTYQLVPFDPGGIAKMDALIVKIDLVSAA